MKTNIHYRRHFATCALAVLKETVRVNPTAENVHAGHRIAVRLQEFGAAGSYSFALPDSFDPARVRSKAVAMVISISGFLRSASEGTPVSGVRAAGDIEKALSEAVSVDERSAVAA